MPLGAKGSLHEARPRLSKRKNLKRFKMGYLLQYETVDALNYVISMKIHRLLAHNLTRLQTNTKRTGTRIYKHT
jgi:hypothetical protein